MRHLVTIVLVFMVLSLCSLVFATDLPEFNRADPWSRCDDDQKVKLYCVNHYLFAVSDTGIVQVWDTRRSVRGAFPVKCDLKGYVQEED